MKQIFATILLATTSVAANAQLQKGNLMFGGSIGGAGYSGGVFSLSLQPRAGYFVTDRFVTGLALNGNYSRYRFLDGSAGVATSLGGTAQVFGRYYFVKKDEKKPVPTLAPFAEVGGGFYVSRISNYLPFYYSQRFTGATGYLSAGTSYFLTPSVALEGRLTGTYMQYSRPHSFVLVHERSLNADFGFQIFLNRGKAKKSEAAEVGR